MLTLFCLYVNRIPILLNHVIRYPVLPDKFGDKPKVRIFVPVSYTHLTLPTTPYV